MATWNCNGSMRLDVGAFEDSFRDKDIVFFSKTHQAHGQLMPHVVGYRWETAHRTVARSEHGSRGSGGVAVLFREELQPLLHIVRRDDHAEAEARHRDADIILLGDFNARTGNAQTVFYDTSDEMLRELDVSDLGLDRCSQDREQTEYGRYLTNRTTIHGLAILQRFPGAAGFTCFPHRHGASTVDYVMAEPSFIPCIQDFIVGARPVGVVVNHARLTLSISFQYSTTQTSGGRSHTRYTFTPETDSVYTEEIYSRLCTAALGGLERLCSQVQFHEPQTKLWLFDTLVASAMLYGVQICGSSVGQDGWRRLERPLVSMISRLIRAKASVPNAIIRAQLAAPPMEIEALTRSVSFVHSLWDTDRDRYARLAFRGILHAGFALEQYHPAIMAPLDKREVEEMIARAISQVKKEADKALNTEMRKLSDKIKQLEEERKQMQEQIKELDTKQGSWIEVVKKNIKKEVREERAKEEVTMVQDTLEEEKLRNARRLNVRITGLPEGASPDTDAHEFCRSLGYTTMPFTRVWRARKDATRSRALILQMQSYEDRVAFFRKRAILRGRPGGTIYMDEDLTRMQIEHRRTCMPQILQARRSGRKAFYRDGRVFIDGRPTK
ncbi:hypothetical protein L7F22_014317 [Adiantum nelumboides]|nr:hypothetical protein [Adiantum nelumboides]